MDSIVVGDVSVTRVREYYGPVGMTPGEFFPESSPGVWEQHADWLEPDFVDPKTGVVNSAIQTWVLRSEGRTILVDTGVGNHKERPYSPVWNRLDTDFLARLAAAGVAPEDVDVVVNTHVHVDHVGWNTRLDGRSWVPTFPNATYLVPKADFDFWNPENGNTGWRHRGNQNVFEDSVAPVHAAGLTQLWEGGHRIDGSLTLEAAPGHTPGSSVLRLESGSDRAVFVGDLLHTAEQFLEPDANSCFCEDPAAARAERRRILARAAEENALVFPAHLGGHGAAEVQPEGGGYAVRRWGPFSRYTPNAEQEAAR